MHVYRWDLDRTYLETEIHSVRGLVRAAFEEAHEKKTVPGAAALIRGLQASDPSAQLCVLSGSPTQMRTVLAQKLALDGVRVDRLLLKDNLGNLRRGRLRAVRGQIGYKLPLLLEERRTVDSATTETLFGDDAEVDGLIYATYAAVLAGEIGTDTLVEVLRAGDAYPDTIERALEAARGLVRADAVEDIFIRLDRGLQTVAFRLLGSRVRPVYTWLQASVCLQQRGRLPIAAVEAVYAQSALTAEAAANQFQDLARRQICSPSALMDALSSPGIAGLRARVGQKLALLGARESDPQPTASRDLVGFLRAVRTT
jgi:hypothetical protein